MRVIIPMAGMGKRLRPHTLTVPKPLLPIAGKPIIQRLVEEIITVVSSPVEEIAFIIGDFGKDVEKLLISIAQAFNAKGSIYYQNEPLGTAHAIYCAKESMKGNVIVAFADTLFKADFKIDKITEASIWVQKVDNPSSFGVVKVNENNIITDFIEKPKTPVSDLAIIGIYYFRDGENLRKELKYLIDNNIIVNGEYQLTDVLENMKNKGVQFVPGEVMAWLDCGNKDAVLSTNANILRSIKTELQSPKATLINSTIHEPCFIAAEVHIENSTIGPDVSIGYGCRISGSTISGSIIQQSSVIRNSFLNNSFVGDYVSISDFSGELDLGDYCSVK